MQEILRKKLKDPYFDLANPEASNEIIEPENTKSDKTLNINNNINDNNINNSDNDKNEIELWTEKFTPKSEADIIGHKATIKKFKDWLTSFDDVVINGNKKQVPYSKGGKSENINSRAVLICGPPGIGKTSTVRLLAKLMGYRTFELNASDTRNKLMIQKTVGYLQNSRTLSFDDNNKVSEKNLIIMDEIDGMAGNEDRGGIQTIISIIKSTKIPIVCIANDKHSEKIKSLTNSCYDLKFTRPDKNSVANRLISICKQEGLQVEQNALGALVESVNNDIRQCLNFLQMWKRNHNTFRHKELTSSFNIFNKDSILAISNQDSALNLITKQNVYT